MKAELNQIREQNDELHAKIDELEHKLKKQTELNEHFSAEQQQQSEKYREKYISSEKSLEKLAKDLGKAKKQFLYQRNYLRVLNS